MIDWINWDRDFSSHSMDGWCAGRHISGERLLTICFWPWTKSLIYLQFNGFVVVYWIWGHLWYIKYFYAHNYRMYLSYNAGKKCKVIILWRLCHVHLSLCPASWMVNTMPWYLWLSSNLVQLIYKTSKLSIDTDRFHNFQYVTSTCITFHTNGADYYYLLEISFGTLTTI